MTRRNIADQIADLAPRLLILMDRGAYEQAAAMVDDLGREHGSLAVYNLAAAVLHTAAAETGATPGVGGYLNGTESTTHQLAAQTVHAILRDDHETGRSLFSTAIGCGEGIAVATNIIKAAYDLYADANQLPFTQVHPPREGR